MTICRDILLRIYKCIMIFVIIAVVCIRLTNIVDFSKTYIFMNSVHFLWISSIINWKILISFELNVLNVI